MQFHAMIGDDPMQQPSNAPLDMASMHPNNWSMQPKYSIDAKHAGMNPDFGIDLRSSVSSIDSTLHREALDACDNADFGERIKEIGEY